MDVGVPELLIVLVIVLLVFGANRLPRLARSLGEAISEFRSAQQSPDAGSPESRTETETGTDPGTTGTTGRIAADTNHTGADAGTEAGAQTD